MSFTSKWHSTAQSERNLRLSYWLSEKWLPCAVLNRLLVAESMPCQNLLGQTDTVVHGNDSWRESWLSPNCMYFLVMRLSQTRQVTILITPVFPPKFALLQYRKNKNFWMNTANRVQHSVDTQFLCTPIGKSSRPWQQYLLSAVKPISIEILNDRKGLDRKVWQK